MSNIPVVVKVTQTLIKTGVPEDCSECPIALAGLIAVKAVRPDVLAVTAVSDGIAFWNGEWGCSKKLFQVSLPQSAKTFMDAFDDGEPVAPFEFALEVPSQ